MRLKGGLSQKSVNEWKRTVDELGKHLSKPIEHILDQSAKLVVRDTIRFTPPFGNAPIMEPFGQKKKLGFAAVKKDIYKIFSDLDYLVKQGAIDSKYRSKIRRAYKSKGKQEAKRLLLRKNITCFDVQEKPSKQTHQRNRDKYGRVKWNKTIGKIFILKATELNRYVKSVQERVGTAMSGWSYAAKTMKVAGVAKWAKTRRPKTKGTVTYQKGAAGLEFNSGGVFWDFQATNDVSYAQHLGLTVRPVQRAVKNQVRNLTKRIETQVQRAVERAKKKK